MELSKVIWKVLIILLGIPQKVGLPKVVYFTNTGCDQKKHKYKWTTYNKNDSIKSVHLGTWRLVGDSVFFEHIPENSYLKYPNSKHKVHSAETKLKVLDKKAQIANKYTLYVDRNYVVKKI